MQQLRDDMIAWNGLTRTEYAQREKQRRREREKKRRQRAIQALRVSQTPATVTTLPRLYQVFETRSGMKAVTVRMITTAFSRSNEDSACTVPLSLPYVSILFGPAMQGRAGR